MKVLGLSGAHREGNTDFLVKHALKACEQLGAETEFTSLAKLDIRHCTVCDACRQKNLCVIPDDAGKLYEKMSSADGLIIGSPTYFASVSSKLKALMDRSRFLRRGAALSTKVGGCLAVGASRNGGQENTIREIQNWMFIHEMLVVSDKKTAHFGGIGVAKGPGEVKDDETGLKTAANLGVKVVETLKRVRP